MPTVPFLGGYGDLSGSGLMFRNKLINGDMRIDQRNSGAAINNTSGSQYSCDRFVIEGSNALKFSAQQSSICPPGFIKSLSLTSSANTTPSAAEYYRVIQHIEGQNVADLAWGTPSAKTITISFFVYSTLTGTFSGALRNSAANRSYPFSYSISSASTWEYKTITIPGDTTGTWLTDNGIGISVIFSVGCGSTYLGTAGSWAANNYMGSTGETKLVATSGANLRISALQLESGPVATPFEQRPIGLELSLCQRYYWNIPIDYSYAGYIGGTSAAQAARVQMNFPVPMRATPTQNEVTPTYTVTLGSVTAVSFNVRSNFTGEWSIQGTAGFVSIGTTGRFSLGAEL